MELAPRHKFLRAVASSDILKFRVSEMAFSGVFKRYSPAPRMPCCFVRTRARLGTMPSKNLPGIPGRLLPGAFFERFTDHVNQNWETDALFTISFSFTERFRMVTPQDFAEQSVSRVRISTTKEVSGRSKEVLLLE